MALKEAAQCPAGHPQSFVRGDRLGRCTRCGGALVRAVYDDTLEEGTLVSSGGSGKFVPADVEEGA